MSPTVEFGSKDAADVAREQWGEYLCPDDDRRLKTVRFVEDVPDRVIERAELEAADSRDERASGPGQAELTDHEKDRLDFSKGRANVPWAQSIKAIAQDAGVDDWTAHVDPTLTVDEHREVMEQAAREDQGQRMNAEDSAIEKAGRASRAAQANECDHARGHCRHGDPQACEFLTETCGYDHDEVDDLLADTDRRDDEPEQETLSGKQAGAYSRALGGYRGAIASLRELLDAVRKQRRHAEQAWSAMAAIRRETGEDVEEPRELHRLLNSLTEIPDEHRLSTLHEHIDEGPEQGDVVEFDDQQALGGGRANDQARLAGGEQGERGQGEVEDVVEENPGGMLADEREEAASSGSTEQQIPDEFAVAEGGQHTL
ncbi:hypothetical protein [Halapricum hydrolyticum]|uniref:Uncharacterized protein n=1 Tax=Halapricum hydrolyticum TaxID=2979991 RepID=A0AAE3LDU2_9EURY|nr:hypothetical protein [Halapricum hydrolyticum]MCU4716873.1 hypothetical protein [Halapricum hydrolyticum]MCU4725522.1 hypothetical protein [Halapricum hydrolyticum]